MLLQAQIAHLTSQKRLLADLYCHVQQNTLEHLRKITMTRKLAWAMTLLKLSYSPSRKQQLWTMKMGKSVIANSLLPQEKQTVAQPGEHAALLKT